LKYYSLKKQSTFLFIGSFTASIIHLLTTLILVRVLPVSDYGVYQKFLLLSTTLLALSGFGIVPSLYYYYPTSDDRGKSIYVIQSALLIFAIGIMLNIVLLISRDSIISYFNMHELYPLIFLVVGVVFINHFSALINAILVLNKNIWYNLFYHPFEKLFQLIIVLSFVIIKNNYTYAIMGLFIYNVIKLLFIIFYIIRNYDFNNIKNINKLRVINQLKYSIPLWYGIVLITISAKIDKFIVVKYIDTEQFAIYTIALSSIPFLGVVYNAFNQVAIAKITVLLKNNAHKEVVDLLRNIISKQLSITIPAIVFFWYFCL